MYVCIFVFVKVNSFEFYSELGKYLQEVFVIVQPCRMEGFPVLLFLSSLAMPSSFTKVINMPCKQVVCSMYSSVNSEQEPFDNCIAYFRVVQNPSFLSN